MSDMKWLDEIEAHVERLKRIMGGDVLLIRNHVMDTDRLTKALRVAIEALEKTTITLANCDQHCLSATRANDDAVKALAEIERMGSGGDA